MPEVYTDDNGTSFKFYVSSGTAVITECNALTGAQSIPQTVVAVTYSSGGFGQGSISTRTQYTVTAIGNYAFRVSGSNNLNTNGAQITSITFPNTVTTIGNYAFYKCNVLTSVTLPNTLTSIGSYSFQGCTSLLNVSIPGSVTTIAGYAFNGCSNLRSVTFANTSNISTLQAETFTNCNQLSGVTLPTSIATITNAFDTQTVVSYYGQHYAITDFGINTNSAFGITYGNTLSISAELQTQTITIRTSTINPTTDKLTFTIRKNHDSFYTESIWPNGVYGTTKFGAWALDTNGTQGTGIAGTRITGTLTLTYTPYAKTSSYYDSDFCNINLSDPSGGIEGSGIAAVFKVYAKVLYINPTTLDSRLTALNGRAMFNINVKEEGDTSALVQLYTSTLGGTTAQNGSNYIQDCRFNQTYLFGPANDTPCDIKIDTTSYSTVATSYGTAKSSMRATVFLAYSDYRLKHNVETLNKTHTVDDIRVVKYTSDDNTPHFGVIAHELAEVYPELVKGEKDKEMFQSVSYIELIPLLINEVQTIKKEMITLKKKKEQLTEHLEQLTDYLDSSKYTPDGT